jgi:hypothetical protein
MSVSVPESITIVEVTTKRENPVFVFKINQ